MNDVETAGSSAQPVKVRLVTFDWLPFTDDLSASEALFDAMDSLSAESVFFESHYLQRQGVSGIVDGFRDAVVWHNNSVPRYSVCCFDVPGRSSLVDEFAAASDQIKLEVSATPREASAPFAEEMAVHAEDPFFWMHFVAGPDVSDGVGLDSVLPLIQQLREQQCVVLVTSLFGRQAEPTRFESRLPEALIHAPLWLVGTREDSARVGGVTGSFDIGLTIEALLTGSRTLTQPEIHNSAAPLDLCRPAGRPGLSVDRALLIQWSQWVALRTNEFLLVHMRSLDGSESEDADSSLYAKPEDVWNVNDVSSEYHDTFEQLRRQLV